MSPSTTPATGNAGRCDQVQRLPRKCYVHVAKCHTCHANGMSMSPSATLATQSGPHRRPRGPKRTPRLPRRMQVDVARCQPATPNEDGCEQAPRLPRKVPRRPGPVPQVLRLPRQTQVDVSKCHKFHACHAKRRLM